MAQLRGQTVLWNAATVNPGSTPSLYSAVGYVGPGPYVAIYITANQSGTYAIQAGVNATGVEAGRNAWNGASLPDGGLLWFPYTRPDGNETAISVVANTPVCIDLSPFAPQIVRLLRTDGGTSATVSAYMSVFGAD
jgi:hypothetical protein